LSFAQLWPIVCVPHYMGEETSQYMIERSLLRPRNLLKIFNHCRGFATNFNRARIEAVDIEKGLRSYSQDLLTELDRELNDVVPIAKDLLYHFIDVSAVLGSIEIKVLMSEAGIEEADFDRIVDFLLYYGVLGIQTDNDDYYIYSVNYDLKMLKIRAERAGAVVQYVINPAFWPALGIRNGSSVPDNQATLAF